ncbi:peptide-methionine (S)-S-oxide reductase MsrA [Haloferula sp.]|uniref:peptide-methionine (S)-S-oxide reductase MsrA n=1 Tax=Haloferula sp. TaxID=2497595 RepID=UPI00329D776D
MKTTLLLIATLLFPVVGKAEDLRKATFAAGCFWCLEAIYERVPGVTGAVSGYTGGKESNPTYQQVGSGATTHAEAVQVTYDAEKVSLNELLDVFWRSHDPTDGRGVAPDFGKQYRSELYYGNSEEKKVITASKAALQKTLKKPIATKVVKFTKFWPAENYHQDYVRLNPNNSYVRNVSIPRLIETGFKE